jgi:hypothetical protein
VVGEVGGDCWFTRLQGGMVSAKQLGAVHTPVVCVWGGGALVNLLKALTSKVDNRKLCMGGRGGWRSACLGRGRRGGGDKQVTASVSEV